MNEILKVAEKVTVRGRDRYLMNGEIVALQCLSCREAFELDQFSKGSNLAGKQGYCKSCDKARVLKWEAKNPEKKRIRTLASVHNLRARAHLKTGNLAEYDLRILFKKATENGQIVCMVSNKPLKKPTVAHVLPVEEAGSKLENLIVTSSSVNILQGSQSLFEFLLTEKGQQVADIETVQYTLHWLAGLNSTNERGLLSKHLSKKQVEDFMRIYY